MNHWGYQNHQALYQTLFPWARQILEVTLESDYDESTQALVDYIINFHFVQDDSYITKWLPSNGYAEDVTKARMLEVLAHWIQSKARTLDALVPAGQYAQQLYSESLQDVHQRLERLLGMNGYQGSTDEVLTEFIYEVVVVLLGQEAACLGSALAAMIVNQVGRQELLSYLACPAELVAELVLRLKETQAKVIKVVMEMYAQAGLMTYDDSKNIFMMFFQYYTVDTTTGILDIHETREDTTFMESKFRVNLIDSWGSLLKLLLHLEEIVSAEGAAVAVDFEGMKLSRHGALCLVQMSCYDDPTLVYVIDVHLLGRETFTLRTKNGTTLRGLLEDQNIRKVWFDPRNDADALYHQFGVMPRGSFDLQLAEVADRRSRDLNVHYVQGLGKCLTQCPALQTEQKVFAERINGLGKNLYEPKDGGTYEVFQRRPLHPVILVYSAHDVRYMLALYEQYVQCLGEDSDWVTRVLKAGDVRCQWCLYSEYVLPGAEAPDF
jgi:hypothetical protein